MHLYLYETAVNGRLVEEKFISPSLFIKINLISNVTTASATINVKLIRNLLMNIVLNKVPTKLPLLIIKF